MTMKPAIENSDRGITINKTLAWTLICGIGSVCFFFGVELTNLSAGVAEIQRETGAATSERAGLEARLRGLETREARANAQSEALTEALQDIRRQQQENNALLRQLLQRVAP